MIGYFKEIPTSKRLYDPQAFFIIHERLYSTTPAMSSREPQDSARRSRSPQNQRLYERSRSPRSHRHHQASYKHKRSKLSTLAPLPLQASKLNRHDFGTFKPMFELYLDIQKQKVLDELPDYEVKGRWKSFVGKWYISTCYL